jgi:hypothetical protein
MSNYLLDSDIIIWHLRGRKEITDMLKDLQRSGSSVRGKDKRRGGKNQSFFGEFEGLRCEHGYCKNRCPIDS